MAPANYRQLELETLPSHDGEIFDSSETALPGSPRISSYGKAKAKDLIDWIDVFALILSLTCLIISVLAILPGFTFAWRLGFEGQIVLIGFTLSIMNLCMKRVLPSLLCILEAKWGPSRLHNYDAILTNQFLASRASAVWRTLLLLLVLLPLGLSVAYKRFLGGYSTAHIPRDGSNSTYGLFFPTIGAWGQPSDPFYLQTTAYAAFRAASADDSKYPDKFPVAYGYNLLLLNEGAAAVLDLPSSEYLQQLQSQLRSNESYQISASVTAFIASRDMSEPPLTANDTFWDNAFRDASKAASDILWDYMASYYLHQPRRNSACIGMGPTGVGYTFLGIYNGTANGPYQLFNSTTDPDVIAYREAATMFNVEHALCNGTWRLDNTGISLLEGNCTQSTTKESASLVSISSPYHLDTMPELTHFLFDVAGKDSPWQTPLLAVSTATSFWARALYLNQGGSSELLTDKLLSYNTTYESIISTRSTLNAEPLLYIVLSLQPVITLIAIILASCFYTTPITKGFGLISILAGIHRPDLDLLGGAGASGNVTKPVTLGIVIEHGAESDVEDHNKVHRLRYSLSTSPRVKSMQRIQRHVEYD